ncbi:MAG: class I SAM-dependent methyltransferase [Acidobacteria bacterium]|nr:class I SAM-dependent methyltransferase [Acidobacteriota bacterium]MCB9396352.1 class I SAM-dependent methyltransferase [Acidobacteriota bacterium]
MVERQIVTNLHTRTQRDYRQRVFDFDKAACAEKATQWGYDYWDGERQYGYGGYRYDGRWKPVAQQLIDTYQLKPGHRVLDIGCGKAFLLHELKQLMPDLEVCGLDLSTYALEHAKPEVQPYLVQGNATQLPFPAQHFDLVFSILTLHNLPIYDLAKAFQELNRVQKTHALVVTESFRNEQEKVNLLYWQLTCRAFFSKEEWLWLADHFGYRGDWEFVYFE